MSTANLCLAFIDYEKALDSIETVVVVDAIREPDVKVACCTILADTYRGHQPS